MFSTRDTETYGKDFEHTMKLDNRHSFVRPTSHIKLAVRVASHPVNGHLKWPVKIDRT